MSLESLGFILSEQNKYEEAEEVYREALTYRERVYGASPDVWTHLETSF
jgi:hypothetical protein